jgi:hypothetical protein
MMPDLQRAGLLDGAPERTPHRVEPLDQVGIDRGGHFPAMEVPDLLIEDIRAFLRPLR